MGIISSTQKILGRMMQKYGRMIEIGECGLSSTEINAMVELLATREVSMEQGASLMHMDRTTMSRQIKNEQFPRPRKHRGGRKYYFLKDLIRHRRKRAKKA